MPTLTYSGTLVVHRCWCGIGHAIPSDLDVSARRNGTTVYCPLGHAWVISGPSLEKQLAQARGRGSGSGARLRFDCSDSMMVGTNESA